MVQVDREKNPGDFTRLQKTLASLTDEDIIQVVGPSAYGQGQAVYQRGDITEITLNAEKTEVLAKVRGAGVDYNVWISQPGDAPKDLDMTCTCRTGLYCKHIAAALWQARSKVAHAGHSWRQLLAPLLAPRTEGQNLALAIDLNDPHLPITPRRQTETGEWTSRRATWSDLTSTRWSSVSADVRSDHLNLIRKFWHTSRSQGGWTSPNRVTLAMFGEQAFDLLAAAELLGIQLFAEGDQLTPLTINHNAARFMAQSDEDKDGDLTVSLVAHVADQQTTRFKVFEAGKILILHGEEIVRIAANQEEITKLASQRRRIVIPAEDRADFMVNYAPALRHLKRDSDQLGQPVLAGKASLDGDIARIVWMVEYRSGSSTIQMTVADARARKVQFTPALEQTIEQVRHDLSDILYREEPGRIAVVDLLDIPKFLSVARKLEKDNTSLRWELTESIRNLRFAQTPLAISVSAIDAADPDWFDLKLRVLVDGEEIPFGHVLHAIAENRRWIKSPNGVWVQIPISQFDRLSKALSEASDAPFSSSMSIPGRRVGVLATLEDNGIDVSGDATWLTRLRRLLDTSANEDIPHPEGTELRAYQKSGVTWMEELTGNGFGALLADDMGLGKTLQILTLIKWKKDRGQLNRGVLVVCPTSVTSTGRDECARFFPDLKLAVVEGTSKTREKSVDQLLAENDIVVTSWTLLRLDSEEYASVDLDGAVFDEAQAIKNASTLQSKSAKALRADWKIAATGTPVENTVTDLWSIMAVINPGVLPRFHMFNALFKRPIEQGSDPDALKRLHQLTGPFMRRRTKEVVAADLPQKIEQLLSVELDPDHREAYDNALNSIRKDLVKMLGAPKQNAAAILSALTKLRILSLDPALIEPGRAWNVPAKTQLLLEHLETLVARGHSVLVFSQFTSYLRRLNDAVQRLGIKTAYLDGSTRNRADVISGFREGDAQVFLISLRAGGVGLTLTEADYVYIMDPWWNPAVESQAIDRVHRIGQDKTVNVYRFCAADTIEEKVIALQERKRQLIDQVVVQPMLTAEDLLQILS